MRFSGVFFAATKANETPGEIELTENSATIYSKGNIVCSNINIESIQNSENIFLENGFLFVLDSSLPSAQERLLSNNLSRSIKWIENFSLSKAIFLSAALVFFFFLFRYSLNLAIPLVVNIFPATWEQKIGENTYSAMRKTVLQTSGLSRPRIERLREKATDLAQINGFNSPEIIFHDSDLIGANALAFPGGPIVVTDDLVILLQTDELILSVVAHEFAHIQERHSLQQIIEVVGIAAVASVVLGSDDTLIEEASILGVNLWANKNSRGFEKKADLLAQQYLQKAGFAKSTFATAIKKLTKHYCSKTAVQNVQHCIEQTDSGWLSTHPSGAERLKYLSHSH